MIVKKYQSYIYLLFLRKFILISFIFFCLVIIINFFEEIKFSEKNNIDVYYSVYLSLLNAPSVVFEIFPFIFLITVKTFYLYLSDKKVVYTYREDWDQYSIFIKSACVSQVWLGHGVQYVPTW